MTPSHPALAAPSSLSCILLVLFSTVAAPWGSAQDHRLINLWVDGKYGDDTTANQNAPQNNPNCRPANRDTNSPLCAATAQWWPNDHTPRTNDPNTSGCCSHFGTEILLHAPWPFQTINNGALGYLQNNYPACQPPAPPAVLPMGPTAGYVSPCTGKQWTYTIIHLMPGHYGRRDPAQGPNQTQYPHSGLFTNDETFPIDLPDYVSIQGASALNTVIDLWDYTELEPPGGTGPAFRFGAVPGSNGIESFIDSVSIFGAFRVDRGDPIPNSAIYITEPGGSDAPAVTPTITNCFLFGNGIGILVDANPVPIPEPPEFQSSIHATIVNNTIAWNGVGIWNGQLGQDGQGWAVLNVINNILDSVPVDVSLHASQLPVHWQDFRAMGWPAPGTACFEGVALHDLTVLAIAPGTFRDYNAYEHNLVPADKYNTGVAFPWLALFNTTAPRPMAGGTPAIPGVDIRPITDGGAAWPPATQRGVLYLRDLILAGSLPGSGGPWQPSAWLTTAFDQSPGDFRLSPNALDAWTGTPTPPDRMNPCIDAGWSAWPATMQNGTVLQVPGRLSAVFNNGTWTFDYTKNDCEGYGNPRVQKYFPYNLACVGPPEPCLHIDIGADEVGECIAVGYRFQTTLLFRDTTPPGAPYDNRFVWWIGPSETLHGVPPFAGVHVRPHYTHRQVVTCWDYRWYNDPQHTCTPGYYQPALVDIMPHLLPDVHPWWALGTGTAFPTNPIWQCWSLCGGQVTFNAFLYVHPIAGVINPPGTWFGPYTGPACYTGGAPSLTFNYLDGTDLGSGPPCAGKFRVQDATVPAPPVDLHSFLPWLHARDNATPPNSGPDSFGPSSILMLRYSVEFPDQGPWGMPSNIQSFAMRNL